MVSIESVHFILHHKINSIINEKKSVVCETVTPFQGKESIHKFKVNCKVIVEVEPQSIDQTAGSFRFGILKKG